MWIFAEVPWGGSVKRQLGRHRELVDVDNPTETTTAIFSVSLAVSSKTLEMRPALSHSDMQSVVSFLVTPECMTLNPYFALNYSSRAGLAGSDRATSEK